MTTTQPPPHQWRSDNTCAAQGCDVIRHPRPEPNWLAHTTDHPHHHLLISTEFPATCSCGAQAEGAFRWDSRRYGAHPDDNPKPEP